MALPLAVVCIQMYVASGSHQMLRDASPTISGRAALIEERERQIRAKELELDRRERDVQGQSATGTMVPTARAAVTHHISC